jgi:outer membrane protein OmpA-like peptidoglycan-associated protein
MLSSRRLDITSYSDLELYDKTVLFGVFFKGGTDKMLGSSSIITLRKLLKFLKGYPTRKILITGHICCSEGRDPSTDGRNNRNGSNTLSLDRAKVVYEYLIKNGISKDRLQYEGKAYLEPLDWEETRNRRVEITITQ